MDLIQARFVTDDVEALASFYARLVGAKAPLNDYYTEVRTGVAGIAFSRRRFTEADARGADCPQLPSATAILDFHTDDIDGQYERVSSLGVDWVMAPTDQPWGKRSMMFRDPEGHLVNVFAAIGSR
jgi:uncharacterized glyoxalase superfamily protein PhnB